MSSPGFSGISSLIAVIQIFFVIVVGLYFWNLPQPAREPCCCGQGVKKEMEKDSAPAPDPLAGLWLKNTPSSALMRLSGRMRD